MASEFTGFTTASFRFLNGLRKNNAKPWFEAHKAEYQEHILKPLQALVAELAPVMLGIDHFLEVTPALSKTVSRIYRDTRFSRGKSPYKTNHWITFKRLKKDWNNFPAFFFELSPDSYRYGMGFYSADRVTMDKFRESLDSNPAPFLATTASYTQGAFTLEGEAYKRPLKVDIQESLRDWYNRKSFYLVCNRQVQGNVIDISLATDLASAFESLAPLYHYLLEATNQ
jgi:uncharacterized protein (TIGR02453 family)